MKKDIFTRIINAFYSILLLFVFTSNLSAQTYDLLLKGGTVIDTKNSINEKMDVAIKDGKIAAVSANISKNDAKSTIDASGLLITPGLIDMHGHHFVGPELGSYNNGFNSVLPDGFTFRTGVTTVVDAGGPGWKNFEQFKETVIDKSKTRVLSFLNIVGLGMKGGHIEQNISDMDSKLTAHVAKKYPDLIVGIKLAHFNGHNWDPLDRAVAAGVEADIPVMIDFGGSEPALSIEKLFLEKLRPGDIFTHAYAQLKTRESVVDKQGNVKPFIFKAQKRGIVFDVGHGGGSFAFQQAIPALKQGFMPNSISTDLHIGSMNGGMKTMLNVMSKFVNMGMSVYDVIGISTWKPAEYIKHKELGHLSVGAEADIAVIKVEKGKFGFIDSGGNKMMGSQKLECELTIRAGRVVYDLNGISRPMWND